MDSQQKGDLAEIKIAAELKRLGWDVLLPFGDGHRYDLVAERDDEYKKLQVKHGTITRDSVEFRCYCSGEDGNKSYTADEIDGFAVYSSVNDDCYWVDIHEANETKMALNLLDNDAKNPASDFWLSDEFK